MIYIIIIILLIISLIFLLQKIKTKSQKDQVFIPQVQTTLSSCVFSGAQRFGVEPPDSWSQEPLLIGLPSIYVCGSCNRGSPNNSVEIGCDENGLLRITTTWSTVAAKSYYSNHPSIDAMFNWFFYASLIFPKRNFYWEQGGYAYTFTFSVPDLTFEGLSAVMNCFTQLRHVWGLYTDRDTNFPFAPIMNFIFALWPSRADSSKGIYKYGNAGCDYQGNGQYCISTSNCLCIPLSCDSKDESLNMYDPSDSTLGAVIYNSGKIANVTGIIMVDYEKMDSSKKGGMLVYFLQGDSVLEWSPLSFEWNDSYAYVNNLKALYTQYGSRPNCWMSLMWSNAISKMEFPYLSNDDIIPLNEHYNRPSMNYLLLQWLWTFNPNSKYVGDINRFNFDEDAPPVGETTTHGDYNINSPEGRQLCKLLPFPPFCKEYILPGLCASAPLTINSNQEPSDLTNCLDSNCSHIETDTCRIFYRTNVPGKIHGDSALMSRYMTPFCMTKFNYLIDNLDYCRSNPNDDECKYLNNLFNQNGNCSCFLTPDQVLQYMEGFGILGDRLTFPSGTCYPDCAVNLDKINYPSDHYYNLYPCDNTLCIVNQSMVLPSIWANDSTINLVSAAISCCAQTGGAASCLPGGQGPILETTFQKITSGALTVGSLLLIILIIITLLRHH